MKSREGMRRQLMYRTLQPLYSPTTSAPPLAPPLRFVRGYVMVWLTLPVYFVNINGASARRVPFTRLTHTHMHTHVPFTPLCPSPSLSAFLLHRPHKMLLNGNI